MKVTDLEIKGGWRGIADAARTTVNMEKGRGEPSSEWKTKILLAEHSPIRKLVVSWKWKDLKSWISVHFVRHKIGIEHWVQSQRPDRQEENDYNRDERPQGTLITHECEANAQAIINISRKRLCNKAHEETRAAWEKVLYALQYEEPELASVCVPECIYRGFCPEMNSCGFVNSQKFKTLRQTYIRVGG